MTQGVESHDVHVNGVKYYNKKDRKNNDFGISLFSFIWVGKGLFFKHLKKVCEMKLF